MGENIMLKGPANIYRIRHSLLQGICGAALANAMILPAAAQESTAPVSADEENPNDIVVTGIRANLESAQNRVVSHIKIKNWNLAQVEFVDLLRKITQTIQRQLGDQPAGGGAGGAGQGLLRRP